MIIEERYLRTYHIHPFRMVGLEGLWNLLFTAIMLVGYYFIKCDAAY